MEVSFRSNDLRWPSICEQRRTVRSVSAPRSCLRTESRSTYVSEIPEADEKQGRQDPVRTVWQVGQCGGQRELEC